jgi:hypothetical protein
MMTLEITVVRGANASEAKRAVKTFLSDRFGMKRQPAPRDYSFG